MNSSKELLLVRLAREFPDLPETAIVETVNTLQALHLGSAQSHVDDQARSLLTAMRLRTRRRAVLDRPWRSGAGVARR